MLVSNVKEYGNLEIHICLSDLWKQNCKVGTIEDYVFYVMNDLQRVTVASHCDANTEEDEIGDDVEVEMQIMGIGGVAEEAKDDVVQVALHSMMELGSPKTLKIKGSIGVKEVVVLIDKGATDNFIFWVM